MMKARESKEEILQQIKELEAEKPIRIHGNLQPKGYYPLDSNYLSDVVEDDDFQSMDSVTYEQIGNWFDDLSNYYQEYAEEEEDAGIDDIE